MAINLETYTNYCGICIHNIGIQSGKIYCNAAKKAFDVKFDSCAEQVIQKDANGNFDKTIKPFKYISTKRDSPKR